MEVFFLFFLAKIFNQSKERKNISNLKAEGCESYDKMKVKEGYFICTSIYKDSSSFFRSFVFFKKSQSILSFGGAVSFFSYFHFSSLLYAP